jgi:hypothetical protein
MNTNRTRKNLLNAISQVVACEEAARREGRMHVWATQRELRNQLSEELSRLDAGK